VVLAGTEWSPACIPNAEALPFDHEKAAFSLKSGHQDLACEECHGSSVPKAKEERSSVENLHGSQVIQVIFAQFSF
jgi:hypothetical protein